MKRARVTSVNPFLRDECKVYQLLCCAITLYTLIMSYHTKWSVRVLLAEVQILQGVPEPLGTLPPYALHHGGVGLREDGGNYKRCLKKALADPCPIIRGVK